MSSYTPERARRLDIFKLIVLLILLALLLWLFCRNTPGASPPPTAVGAVTTVAPPTKAPDTAAPPTEAPIAPVLISPKGGEEVKGGQDTTLSGTGAPGSHVQIVVDGKPVGTVTVSADGAWSLPVKLDPGEHSIVVQALDAGGKVTSESKPTNVSVEAGTATPTLTSPRPGDTVGGEVTLSGTGAPGSQVQIVVDGKPVGTVTVGPDGMWLFPVKLDPGEHSIVVQALDAGGKVVAESEAVKVTAEAAAVTPPTLTSPKPGDKVAVGDVALSGRGAPGSKVQIVVDGEVVGTADVGADGAWSFPVALEAGEHTITVQALDAGGNVAAESEPVKVTAGAPVVKPALTSPKPGDKLNSGDAALSGTGAPGSQVQIVVDGKPVGTITVGADGTWAFPIRLEPGDHQIAAQGLDAGGNVVSESDAVSVSVAAPAPAPTPTPKPQPSGGGVCLGPHGRAEGEVWIVGGCDTMTYIGQQTGIPLGALIAANPQVNNPDLIYPDQRINLPR